MSTIETLAKARLASTPLVAVATPDQHAFATASRKDIADRDKNVPLIQWDHIRGMCPANDVARSELQRILDMPADQWQEATSDPINAIEICARMPASTVVHLLNASRYLDDAQFIQGVSNLRDAYKADRRMLIMLGASFKLPEELINDVVLLDEALPDDAALLKRLSDIYDGTKNVNDERDRSEVARSAVDAARGLSLFAAEQVFAMSMTKSGVDLDSVWERKESAINQELGLSITRDTGFQLNQLGALDTIAKFSERLFKGRNSPRVIVRIDEAEKSFAASGGGAGFDSSGVSQDALGVVLQWMEDFDQDGLIAVGPPGSGKTAYSKALGTTYDVPTIQLDLGALKGSYVGESERNIRRAMKVIDSIAGGRAFVVATCNRLEVLPPELRRRFRSGTWVFSLPSKEERATIWSLYLSKYRLDSTQTLPDDTAWTGAEIRNCCDLAWRLDCTLVDAAHYIVPVAQADPGSVYALYRAANGRWLSASKPGKFDANEAIVELRSLFSDNFEREVVQNIPDDVIRNINFEGDAN